MSRVREPPPVKSPGGWPLNPALLWRLRSGHDNLPSARPRPPGNSRESLRKRLGLGRGELAEQGEDFLCPREGPHWAARLPFGQRLPACSQAL